MENNKKTILSEEEYNTTYSALKLIECLCRQGQVPRHVYKNILLEYADRLDISEFKIVA